MENMRFKVGDRVRINSLDWYNKNKDETGFICFNYVNFIPEMSRYCSEILTINKIVEEFECYLMSECAFTWTDEMIEELVENEPLDVPTMTTEFVKLRPKMTAEEAILQMELLEHSFFVFLNIETDVFQRYSFVWHSLFIYMC